MVNRVRKRTSFLPQGGHAKSVFMGSVTLDKYQYPTKELNEICTDTIDGTRNPHALLITKRAEQFDSLSGKWEGASPNTWKEYTNYIPDYYTNTIFDHLTLPSPPTDGSLVSKLIARSNPGAPHVNVPLMVYELKDLVPALQDAGTRIRNARGRSYRDPGHNPALSQGVNSIADEYLAFSFSFNPLVNDLRKLLHFSDEVDKRMSQLRLMQQQGDLRRKRTLQTDLVTTQGIVSVESQMGFLIQAKYTRTTRRTIWGTVRYRPEINLPFFATDLELKKYCRRIVSNTSNGLHAADLWNAVPWTWLVDYFLGVSDFLEAYRLRIPVRPYNACIMTLTETTHEYRRTEDSHPFSGGSGFSKITTKRRALSGPLLNLSMPMLNARQLSILGALSISRNRARLAT